MLSIRLRRYLNDDPARHACQKSTIALFENAGAATALIEHADDSPRTCAPLERNRPRRAIDQAEVFSQCERGVRSSRISSCSPRAETARSSSRLIPRMIAATGASHFSRYQQ